MSKFWGSLFALFILSSLQAQLVNIEAIRMHTDSTRLVLDTEFLFNYSNADGIYIYQFGLGLNTQYKTENLKNTFFFSGYADLIRSQDQDFQNGWFIHFRYNRKLGKSEKLRLEAFVQDQNNALLSINSRNLIGLGLRLKLIDKDIVWAYLGNSYMYEKEVSDVADQTYYNHRNSTYLSLTLKLPESELELVNTIYFQPLYTDISNFRVLEQFKIEMPLKGNLRVFTLFNYFYNNINPFGTSEFTSSLNVGLTYSLEKKLTPVKYNPYLDLYTLP